MIGSTNQVKSTTKMGRFGEEIALRYLKEKGYSLIGRNFHIRGGELDLICKKNDIIVFVEVKLRTSHNFGTGGEALTRVKKQKLLRAAFTFLQTHPARWRMDLLDIHFRKSSRKAFIKHFINILEA